MVACCLSLLVTATAFAAARKGILFWNLTGETLTDVSPAPVGTDHFGTSSRAFWRRWKAFSRKVRRSASRSPSASAPKV